MAVGTVSLLVLKYWEGLKKGLEMFSTPGDIQE
jgi:hypothetical protein